MVQNSSDNLDALCAWLKSFPQLTATVSAESEQQVQQEGASKLWIQREDVVRGILLAAAEMCNSDPSPDTVYGDDLWGAIGNLLGVEDGCDDEAESRLVVLSKMLCRAVASVDEEKTDEAPRREEMRGLYISRILGLNEDHQLVLMQIIKGEGSKCDEDEEENNPPPSPPNSEDGTQGEFLSLSYSKSYEDATPEINRSGRRLSTPRSRGRGASPPSSRKKLRAEGCFSPPSNREKKLEAKLETLQRLYDRFVEESAISLEREQAANEEAQEEKAKILAESLRLETQLFERESELKATHVGEVASLRKSLARAENKSAVNERAQEELEGLKDELDVLKHSSSRLESTEEQLRKCKTKLMELQDVKEQLSREEQARSKTVQQVIDLENELSSLAPLRRQLETYKARATAAEVQLTDVSDELQKLKEQTQHLSSLNHELQNVSEFQRNEAEELQKMLKEESKKETGSEILGLGEGVSELNPAIAEEITRLRNENTELKNFVARHTQDAVEQLGEDLDDSRRLTESFKKQFLTTKNTLEATLSKLKASEVSNKKLHLDVKASHENISALTTQLKVEKEKAEGAQKAAAIELRAREEFLIKKASVDREKLEAITRGEMAEQAKDYERQIERSLAEVANIRKLATEELRKLQQSADNLLEAEQKKRGDLIRQIEGDHTEAMNTAKAEREDIVKKGKAMIVKERADASLKLKTEREDHEKFVRNVNVTLAKYRQDQTAYEEKVKNKIVSYKKKLHAASSRISKLQQSNDEYKQRIEVVEIEKHKCISDNERLRRQVGSKKGSASDLEIQFHALQREYADLMKQNRNLKENANNKSLPACAGFSLVDKMAYSCGGSVNGSTLTQLRTEYEETVETLNDERRELVMKNSAAITEKQKAEQRAWSLEEELSNLKDELISAQLALQRVDYREVQYSDNKLSSDSISEASFALTECSSKSLMLTSVLENSLNMSIDSEGEERKNPGKENSAEKSSKQQSKLPPKSDMVLTTRSNRVMTPVKDMSKLPAMKHNTPPLKNSLMKYTQPGENSANVAEPAPECKQS